MLPAVNVTALQPSVFVLACDLRGSCPQLSRHWRSYLLLPRLLVPLLMLYFQAQAFQVLSLCLRQRSQTVLYLPSETQLLAWVLRVTFSF